RAERPRLMERDLYVAAERDVPLASSIVSPCLGDAHRPSEAFTCWHLGTSQGCPSRVNFSRRETRSSHNRQRICSASSLGDTPGAADTNARAASTVPCLKSPVCAVDVLVKRHFAVCEPARVTNRKTPSSTQAPLSSDVHDM